MDIVIAFIFYIIPTLMIIWFMVSLVSAQRQRNAILREILEKINSNSVEKQ